MKKIVLSILALMAIVLNVKADDEPTYTAKGTVTSQKSSDGYYVSMFSEDLTDVSVEVYGTDSVVIRKWCGVEGYDVCVEYASDGTVSDIKQSGVSVVSGGYANIYTGLSDYYCLQVYTLPYVYGGTTYYYAEGGVDAETNTGYVSLWGYGYLNPSGYASAYYSITWSVPDGTGIKSIAAESSADAPLFNLAGQRVSKGAKGLVIKNGKKFFNK